MNVQMTIKIPVSPQDKQNWESVFGERMTISTLRDRILKLWEQERIAMAEEP